MEPDWRKIELENRGLAVQSAHFLGEGWNSRAYLVNNELVFRFPKRPEHWEELEREVRFLAFAADLLPLAVPRYTHMSPDSPGAAYGYAVYRYLHGHAMNVNDLAREKRTAAAEVIATFLRPTVLHADLGRDHLLMENDSVVAAIDFGDVNWGDPDYDFMYLFVDFGQAFVEEVAQRYGHRDPEQLRSKLLYFGLVDQIGTILDGTGLALKGQEDEAWLRLKQLLRMCESGA